MAVDAADIVAVEEELARQLPGRWRRLIDDDLRECRRSQAVVGWQVEFRGGELACPDVRFVKLFLDCRFPDSQPLVFAKEAARDFTWPHVESDGYLCLTMTALGSPAVARVMQHLAWAEELLSYSEARKRSEFEREFGSYWAQRAVAGGPRIRSLLAPEGPARAITAYANQRFREVLVAEDKSDLERWLANSGQRPGPREFWKGWMVWLPRPWVPSEFPESAGPLLRDVPDAELRGLIEQGCDLPLIVGTQTQTGPVLVAALISTNTIRRRFGVEHRIRPVPLGTLRNAASECALVRRPVERIDGAWVHGRGRDGAYARLADTHVVIIGVGAIGASVARLLAQAGVGSFTFVDPDDLAPQNTSRHLLGSADTGINKATALARSLARDFPHLRAVVAVPKRFEQLSQADLRRLAESNLIISAGLTFDADATIDDWRRTNADAVPHAMVWAEEFALAGHVVLRVGRDSIRDVFDANGRPREPLTEWPEGTETVVLEAGCGNAFQPHGAIDLAYINSVAARICLDVLSGKANASTHRVWLGNRDGVEELGGICRPMFDRSFAEKDG